MQQTAVPTTITTTHRGGDGIDQSGLAETAKIRVPGCVAEGVVSGGYQEGRGRGSAMGRVRPAGLQLVPLYCAGMPGGESTLVRTHAGWAMLLLLVVIITASSRRVAAPSAHGVQRGLQAKLGTGAHHSEEGKVDVAGRRRLTWYTRHSRSGSHRTLSQVRNPTPSHPRTLALSPRLTPCSPVRGSSHRTHFPKSPQTPPPSSRSELGLRRPSGWSTVAASWPLACA